jgi:hypothetical protein
MRIPNLEASLSKVSQPLLSLYLEASPKGSTGGRSAVNSLPWLKKQAKSLANRIPAVERDAFETQLKVVETFLRGSSSGNAPLIIFSGPGRWVCLHLPSPVSNELHWGQPDLTQLRRIAAEQQNICIVAVDRAGARFFRYEFGELSELPSMKFERDVSQWKRKEHGHMARRDTKMPHGPLRDAFKQRMAEQYQHFYQHLAERTKFVCAKEKLEAVFLVGSERLTKPIESALPREIQDHTVRIGQDLARISPAKLRAQLLPKISEWIRQFSVARVTRLIESDRGSIVGFDETLAELQKGRIGSLLMVRGLDTALRQCANCGYIDRSADPVCATCGGPRRSVMLSEVLDDLAKNHEAKIEILDPAAAKKLAKAGGLGGWLRQPTLAAAR